MELGSHSTKDALHVRSLQTLKANADFVAAHNSDASKSYKLEMNRFAEWSQVLLLWI